MPISRKIKDKLQEYDLDFPTDRRTTAYKKIIKELKLTNRQYLSYLKKQIKKTQSELVQYVGSIYVKYVVISSTQSSTRTQ